MSSIIEQKPQAQKLAAHLALLIPPNRRRLIGAIGLAAIGSYMVMQHQKNQTRLRQKKKSAGTENKASSRSGSGSGSKRATGQALRDMIPLLLKIAGRKIIVIAILAIARTALSNRLARLQGYLFRAAFLRKVPLFARNLVENVVLCAAASALEATSRSWVSFMELQWRRRLTNRLHGAYFDDMTYYKLNYVDRRIDSPEQRICEDIPKLSSGLAELTRELITAVIDATFYAYQLRHYSGTNKYTAAILAYVFGAGTFMTVAAPNFGGLFKKQQALEGSYRQMQTRLRVNAESVAFYNGITKEGTGLREKFRELVSHHARVLGKQWRFSMVQDFLLKYCGATVAVALIIGPFFQGHMRPEATVMGRAQMLSNMRYHTSVIISLFGALGTLGSSSRKLMKLSAYADRIKEMQKVMNQIKAGDGAMGTAKGVVLPSEDSIEFENATVVTPGNATLVHDLNLKVACGTNLLVTGPNGAGKSSLFRVLGGLWPLTEGRIHKPGGAAAESGLSHEIFYVPQRPYVTVGTLQDQLLYPLVADDNTRLPESELRSLLRSVDLESLLDRSGGGEEVTNWGEVLSLGEQQRLGMARLLFHKPRFAILDECTSGVTVDMEERFCELVKDMGCTCITISHRPALMAFHDVVLHLDGEGGWSIHPGHRSLGATVGEEAVGNNTAAAAAIGGASTDGQENASAAAAAAAAASEDGEDNFTVPAPPRPAHNNAQGNAPGQGGKSHHGKKGKGGKNKITTSTSAISKQRADEANAVIRGMSLKSGGGGGGSMKREELLGDGNEGYSEVVVARAPEGGISKQAQMYAPRLALQPAKSSPLARWKSVLKVLLGGNPQQSVIGLSTVAGVIVLRTLLQDRIANLNGRSVDLVLRQDLKGFIRLIGVSVLQSSASAVLAPSLRHMADSLALAWREKLTQAAVNKYLRGNAFYAATQLAGMQDVDQRMSRDIERLCDDLAALIPSMVKPVVDMAWFSLQLWRLTGRRGMGILYLYTALGYGCLRAVTPDFAGLLKKEYQLEGAFRNAHSRLRTFAESVAFFGGGPKEGTLINQTFNTLARHLNSLINYRWAYGAADEFFAKQLPHNVTWLLTLLYALEQKGDFGDTTFQGELVHKIRYLASVVTNCFTAFGELLALPKRFAEISGGINRVSEMLEVLDKSVKLDVSTRASMRASAGGADLDADGIEFRKVDVVTPGGKVLARQLSFKVLQGASLLVTGPNGAGKTSLFRILGGLWPLPDGAVHIPGAGGAMDTKDIYYVPQRPYTTIGTLREQIVYPLTAAHARRLFGDAPDPAAALDAEITALMDIVRLRYLLDREGGWEANKEWGEVMSLGEQQRLGMARLFFHKPRFGILDECTNAISVDMEEALYAHAASLNITLVTITQRTALVKYHARELRLVDGEGGWELREIKPVK